MLRPVATDVGGEYEISTSATISREEIKLPSLRVTFLTRYVTSRAVFQSGAKKRKKNKLREETKSSLEIVTQSCAESYQ